MVFKGFSFFATESIQAIIFDCDGVLVDTEYLKFFAWQEALASVNIELSIEEYKMVAGNSSKKIHEILQDIKNLCIPEDVILLRRVKYRELQAQGVSPINETIELTRHLLQNKKLLGIKLGVASSAPKNEILLNLKQIGLDHEFDVVVSGVDDLESYADNKGKNKPKPYIYLEASKRLNISPEYCLVFEDTQAGIEAATTAGMVTIAIPNWISKGQDFSKANRVINTISELLI